MQEQALDAISRVEELSREIQELRRRVAALEEQRLGAAASMLSGEPLAASAATGGEVAVAAPAFSEAAGMVPVIGRAMLGIAGAYLLRALAESGAVPPLAAVAAGIVYALWWLLSSVRAAVTSHLVATAHVVTAVLVVYPMIWETTVRFRALPDAAAAALLAGFAALGLVVAWRRNLSEVAWITVLAGVATAGGLLMVTHDLVPFTVALLAIAAAVEACACRDHWLGVRGVVALTANLAVLLLTALLTRTAGLPEGYAPVPIASAIVLQIALLAIYLASVAVRTLVRGLPICLFEIVQTAIAFVLSIGGALRLTQGHPWSTGIVAAFCLVGGIACYRIALASLDRAAGRDRDFYTYSTYGALLVVTGSRLWLPDTGVAALWTVLGVAATWFGGRADRSTIRIHGVAYLGLAAAVSGLLAYARQALFGVAPPLAPAAALAAAGALLGYALLWAAHHQREATFAGKVAAVGVAAVAVWSVAGLASAWLIPSTFSFAAPLRTVLLTTLAMALAWTGARWSRAELLWLVYAVMAVTAYKLLVQDFRQGSPGHLAISLVFFGSALVVWPRLTRRASGQPSTES